MNGFHQVFIASAAIPIVSRQPWLDNFMCESWGLIQTSIALGGGRRHCCLLGAGHMLHAPSSDLCSCSQCREAGIQRLQSLGNPRSSVPSDTPEVPQNWTARLYRVIRKERLYIYLSAAQIASFQDTPRRQNTFHHLISLITWPLPIG
jgi:hypothetical protein